MVMMEVKGRWGDGKGRFGESEICERCSYNTDRCSVGQTPLSSPLALRPVSCSRAADLYMPNAFPRGLGLEVSTIDYALCCSIPPSAMESDPAYTLTGVHTNHSPQSHCIRTRA